MLHRWRRVGRWAGLGLLAALAIPAWRAGAAPSAQPQQTVTLAYVYQGVVTLADQDGTPLEQTGPSFGYGQGARLFWTPDGRTLYIARDDGLYATGSQGGAAVQLPGYYGRTLTISQDAATLYYLETVSPQALDGSERVAYPVRELTIALMDGGSGRLAGYYGRYRAGASKADLVFAGALYARDGGLLGAGRPNLWPTYGSNIIGTCCFPDPGLSLFDVGTGQTIPYDETFIPGAAALNLTRTHLAGPTSEGTIRVIDLITGGSRDYTIEIAGGLGEIERIAWSPDDTYLYLVARAAPDNPLSLATEPPFPIDTASATITLYRLNLVTSVIRELDTRRDVYGVPSLAATDRFVFAVVVDPNTALLSAVNAGQVPPGTLSNDPMLSTLMPATHLWRVPVNGGSGQDLLSDVWGVAARPVR